MHQAYEKDRELRFSQLGCVLRLVVAGRLQHHSFLSIISSLSFYQIKNHNSIYDNLSPTISSEYKHRKPNQSMSRVLVTSLKQIRTGNETLPLNYIGNGLVSFNNAGLHILRSFKVKPLKHSFKFYIFSRIRVFQGKCKSKEMYY